MVTATKARRIDPEVQRAHCPVCGEILYRGYGSPWMLCWHGHTKLLPTVSNRVFREARVMKLPVATLVDARNGHWEIAGLEGLWTWLDDAKGLMTWHSGPKPVPACQAIAQSSRTRGGRRGRRPRAVRFGRVGRYPDNQENQPRGTKHE